MKSTALLPLIFVLASAAPAQLGVAKTDLPHPDFLLQTLDGKPGRLSDFRGKPVLLFHFASW